MENSENIFKGNKKMSKEILNTAYHEAGHAAAFIFLDLKFKIVSIEPKNESLGRVTGRVLSKRTLKALEFATTVINKDKIEKDLIIDIAGPIAEAKFKGRFNHLAASADYHKISDFLFRIFENQQLITAYYNYIFLLAKNIIDRRDTWNYIETLARTLIEKRTMTYNECMQLYYEAYQKLMESDNGNLGSLK